jgi:hypothetical protein
MAAMPERAPEVSVFDGVASVTFGDTLLTLWGSPARAPRIRHVIEVAAGLLARTPGTIMACQFLLPSASPPGLGERSAISEGLDIVMPRARRLVTTPLGDAAWSTVVRGVMRAGVMILRQAKLVKIAATPDEAFALLREDASESSPTHDTLSVGLAALHEALGTSSPKRGR